MTMKRVFGGCPNQLLTELGFTVFLGFQACMLAVVQTLSVSLFALYHAVNGFYLSCVITCLRVQHKGETLR
jgi:hypothetical protein